MRKARIKIQDKERIRRIAEQMHDIAERWLLRRENDSPTQAQIEFAITDIYELFYLLSFCLAPITISKCRDCPYYYLEWDFEAPFPDLKNRCTKTAKRIENKDAIPDWCPFLIKEGKEDAD